LCGPSFSHPAFSVDLRALLPERFPLQLARLVMFSVTRGRNWCLVRVTVTQEARSDKETRLGATAEITAIS